MSRSDLKLLKPFHVPEAWNCPSRRPLTLSLERWHPVYCPLGRSIALFANAIEIQGSPTIRFQC